MSLPQTHEKLFMYGKFENNIVSDVKLTSELGPSMNDVLLLWAPSLNLRCKLKEQCKTIKFGSDTSLLTFLVTLSL